MDLPDEILFLIMDYLAVTQLSRKREGHRRARKKAADACPRSALPAGRGELQSGTGRAQNCPLSDRQQEVADQGRNHKIHGARSGLERREDGGIVSQKPFVLLTDPTEQSSFLTGRSKKKPKTKLAIYAREIVQLLQAGYTLDFAREDERPKNAKQRLDLLVLRPPNAHLRRQEAMALVRSRPDFGSTWDRGNEALVITYTDPPLTAETLANMFEKSIQELKEKVAKALQ